MKDPMAALQPLIQAAAGNFSVLVEFRDDLLRSEVLQASKENGDNFKLHLNFAVAELGVPQSLLAQRLKVMDSQISRWANKPGEYYPPAYSRPVILSEVAKILTEHIDAEQARKAQNDAAGHPTFLHGRVRKIAA